MSETLNNATKSVIRGDNTPHFFALEKNNKRQANDPIQSLLRELLADMLSDECIILTDTDLHVDNDSTPKLNSESKIFKIAVDYALNSCVEQEIDYTNIDLQRFERASSLLRRGGMLIKITNQEKYADIIDLLKNDFPECDEF